MKGAGFFSENVFITILEKKSTLFAILAFCCVILFLRFRVMVSFIKM